MVAAAVVRGVFVAFAVKVLVEVVAALLLNATSISQENSGTRSQRHEALRGTTCMK